MSLQQRGMAMFVQQGVGKGSWKCPLCGVLHYDFDKVIVCHCGARRCANCAMVARPGDYKYCPGCGKKRRWGS